MDDLPLDSGFAELLKDWQASAPQSEAGWVFVNPAREKPYHAAPHSTGLLPTGWIECRAEECFVHFIPENIIVVAAMEVAKFMNDDVVNNLRGSHYCLPVKTDESIRIA
jgi:hypothetical protein